MCPYTKAGIAAAVQPVLFLVMLARGAESASFLLDVTVLCRIWERMGLSLLLFEPECTDSGANMGHDGLRVTLELCLVHRSGMQI